MARTDTPSASIATITLFQLVLRQPCPSLPSTWMVLFNMSTLLLIVAVTSTLHCCVAPATSCVSGCCDTAMSAVVTLSVPTSAGYLVDSADKARICAHCLRQPSLMDEHRILPRISMVPALMRTLEMAAATPQSLADFAKDVGCHNSSKLNPSKFLLSATLQKDCDPLELALPMLATSHLTLESPEMFVLDVAAAELHLSVALFLSLWKD